MGQWSMPESPVDPDHEARPNERLGCYKRAYKRNGDSLCSRDNGFKLKKGGFAQVAQRGDRCPIAGNPQTQVGLNFEQPGIVEGVSAHCRESGLDDL